jgi:hypothetical protein
MDEHTDDELDLPIDETVDLYQVLQDKITTISIDNIVDDLEVIKRLLLHLITKKDNVLFFIQMMIQKLNTVAIQIKGFVSFIADQIEDIMYEIGMEAQYNNGMEQLQLRDPPLPPLPIQVENNDTYVENSEDYPLENPVEYPVEIETNTTIPAITIMDTSFRDLQQSIPDTVTETNTTIPGIDITTSILEENKLVQPKIQLPPPIPKKIWIPNLSPPSKQRKKARQKSPVPFHKRIRRNESHKSKTKK